MLSLRDLRQGKNLTNTAPPSRIQDGFNRKGLISNEGLKKEAFHPLRECHAKRQAAARSKGN